MTIETNSYKSNSTTPSIWLVGVPTLFVILWSTGFIGAKFGLPYAEPFTFLGIRFLLVIGLMLLVCLATSAPWPSSWKLAGHIAISGLLVQATYLGGIFSSIDQGLTAGISALVTGFQPALTAIFAMYFLHETVNRRQWIGIGLGFLGILMVVSNRLAFSTDGFVGYLLATIALFGITLGTLYQKRYCTEMDLRTGAFIQFSASAVVIWILAFMFESRNVHWTGEFIFAISWLVVVLSFGAISLLMILIKRGATSKISSLFYLVPPVTALMSFFIFDEALGLLELSGMALTVVGVALVTRN